MLGLFGWKHKVRKLRKRWDRTRERALKQKEPVRRMALESLDRIENNLRLIEERDLSPMDRSRLGKEIEIALAEIAGLLQTKPDDVPAWTAAPPEAQKRRP